jgi:hypothetical protein
MRGVVDNRRTPTRRRIASRIAVISRTDPDDPRLPALRERADILHVAEIAEWARLAATALPPPTHAEILAIAREVAALDAKLAQRRAGAA